MPSVLPGSELCVSSEDYQRTHGTAWYRKDIRPYRDIVAGFSFFVVSSIWYKSIVTLPPPDLNIRYSFAFSLLQLAGRFRIGPLRAKRTGAETVIVVAFFVVAVCVTICSHLIRRFVPGSN